MHSKLWQFRAISRAFKSMRMEKTFAYIFDDAHIKRVGKGPTTEFQVHDVTDANDVTHPFFEMPVAKPITVTNVRKPIPTATPMRRRIRRRRRRMRRRSL
jgi:hypothetical protein